MAIFTRYVTGVLDDLGITLANIGQNLAVAGAVIGSILWVVLYLVFQPLEKKPVKSSSKATPPLKPCQQRITAPLKHRKQYSIVSSFHLSRKSIKDGIYQKNHIRSHESIWDSRKVETNCSVPCIRCRSVAAERSCRFVMCMVCCQSSKTRHCAYHQGRRGLFSNFHFPSVPFMGRSPTQIDLSFSNLQQCPDRVGFIGPQLVTLNLSNNCLHSLPEEIGCLLGLQELLLQNNYLTTLPEIVCCLTKLTDLDVAFNKLESLPSNLGKLQSLTRLRTHNNNLISLPESTGDLKELVELNVSYNKIQALPRSINQLSRLSELYVRSCCLKEVPKCVGSLVRLRQLDLAHNCLSRLPKTITKCSSLEKLWLSWNRVDNLPHDIGRLHLLSELCLEHNNINVLPYSLVSLQLLILKVNGNPLLACEEEIIQYSRNIPWWEKQPKSSSGYETFPKLSEILERSILQNDIPWHDEHLPLNIKERLRNASYCGFCNTPLISRRKRRLAFVTNRFNVPFLPLEMHSCTGPFRSNKQSRLHEPESFTSDETEVSFE